ncbi:hypothetical protein HS088_TW05G00701 [Tripterygium wilfordii]|uniref:S-protein homolog n=1 Tax=Tripterygium wilfordii TaxID=458696 RepID=A0A7J7DNM8_TRIWF|nr:hypothetical protein HS088_TW05G00701 [Tripterygium wilfordii]
MDPHILFLTPFLLLANLSDAELFIDTNVNITNDLGSGIDLNVDCMNDEVDRGEYFLQYQQSFQFSFHANILYQTRYRCTMFWPNECHWFDIYVFKRDNPLCFDCKWMVRANGPCMFNTTKNNSKNTCDCPFKVNLALSLDENLLSMEV